MAYNDYEGYEFTLFPDDYYDEQGPCYFPPPQPTDEVAIVCVEQRFFIDEVAGEPESCYAYFLHVKHPDGNQERIRINGRAVLNNFSEPIKYALPGLLESIDSLLALTKYVPPRIWASEGIAPWQRPYPEVIVGRRAAYALAEWERDNINPENEEIYTGTLELNFIFAAIDECVERWESAEWDREWHACYALHRVDSRRTKP